MPSAPTVSCHSLRSAPALSASSAGAAAAGLPRGRGTFASGGGMAVPRHLATVAGPLRAARCSRLPAGEKPLVRACRLGGRAVAGCVTCSGRRSAGWRPSLLVKRAGLTAHPAAASAPPRCCRRLLALGLFASVPALLPVVWRSVLAVTAGLRRDAPLFQAGLPARPVTLIKFPPDGRNPLQKLAVTASFPLAFLPPSIPGYR